MQINLVQISSKLEYGDKKKMMQILGLKSVQGVDYRLRKNDADALTLAAMIIEDRKKQREEAINKILNK